MAVSELPTSSVSSLELMVLSSCRGTTAAHEEAGTGAKFPCAGCKKECLSELFGTYALVFVGPASIVLTGTLGLLGLESLGIVAFTFGSAVGVLILLLGKYSAIINPALTLAARISGSLGEGLLVPFLFFQTLGGILAGLTLRFTLGGVDQGTSLGSTKLAFGLNPALGFLLEAVGTCVLAISALGSFFRLKSNRRGALLVGSVLLILIVLIGPLTGAGFNPARSLGPALASGYLDNLWLYLVGPLGGALSAGLLFRVRRVR